MLVVPFGRGFVKGVAYGHSDDVCAFDASLFSAILYRTFAALSCALLCFAVISRSGCAISNKGLPEVAGLLFFTVAILNFLAGLRWRRPLRGATVCFGG